MSSLKDQVTTSDELLYSTPPEDLLQLPSHLLKNVLVELRNQNMEYRRCEKTEERYGSLVDLSLIRHGRGRAHDDMAESYEAEADHHRENWQLGSAEEADAKKDDRKLEEDCDRRHHQHINDSMHIQVDPETGKVRAKLERDWHDWKMLDGFDWMWSRQISSQLLYYRLIALFGMLPQSDNIDRYKVIWAVDLVHKDQVSHVEICDYKGFHPFSFDGTEEAKEDPIKLLEFLISDRYLHTYDGVVAGLRA